MGIIFKSPNSCSSEPTDETDEIGDISLISPPKVGARGVVLNAASGTTAAGGRAKLF